METNVLIAKTQLGKVCAACVEEASLQAAALGACHGHIFMFTATKRAKEGVLAQLQTGVAAVLLLMLACMR